MFPFLRQLQALELSLKKLRNKIFKSPLKLRKAGCILDTHSSIYCKKSLLAPEIVNVCQSTSFSAKMWSEISPFTHISSNTEGATKVNFEHCIDWLA